MKHLLLLLLLLSLNLNVSSQQLISQNSWFLAVNSTLNYVFYFKAKNADPDEYKEGNIYIYDINKKTSSLLNSNIYLLEFLNVSWTNDGNTIFISTGDSLVSFSLNNKERKTIYRTHKDGVINNFAVSYDGTIVVVNEKVFQKEGSTQTSYLIKKESIEPKIIYQIIDSSEGEMLKNNLLFGRLNKKVYINNIGRELYEYDIELSLLRKIDTSVSKVYFASEKGIYYTKHDCLRQFNPSTNSYFDVLKGEKLSIDYIGKYQDKIAISLNDNMFLYEDNRGLERISNLRKGRYIYFNGKYAIESLNNSLYLYPIL